MHVREVGRSANEKKKRKEKKHERVTAASHLVFVRRSARGFTKRR
jgi:hypothetical protein